MVREINLPIKKHSIWLDLTPEEKQVCRYLEHATRESLYRVAEHVDMDPLHNAYDVFRFVWLEIPYERMVELDKQIDEFLER